MSKELRKLSEMFSALSDIDKKMSVQKMQVLLLIAENPNLTQVEIMAKLSVDSTNMNRWVGEFEAKSTKRHPITKLPLPGLGWIEKKEDVMNRSRKLLTLTGRGRQALDNLMAHLWGNKS